MSRFGLGGKNMQTNILPVAKQIEVYGGKIRFEKTSPNGFPK